MQGRRTGRREETQGCKVHHSCVQGTCSRGQPAAGGSGGRAALTSSAIMLASGNVTRTLLVSAGKQEGQGSTGGERVDLPASGGSRWASRRPQPQSLHASAAAAAAAASRAPATRLTRDGGVDAVAQVALQLGAPLLPHHHQQHLVGSLAARGRGAVLNRLHARARVPAGGGGDAGGVRRRAPGAHEQGRHAAARPAAPSIGSPSCRAATTLWCTLQLRPGNPSQAATPTLTCTRWC